MHMMMMMMMAIRVLREVNTHCKAAVTEQHYKAFVFIFMNKIIHPNKFIPLNGEAKTMRALGQHLSGLAVDPNTYRAPTPTC